MDFGVVSTTVQAVAKLVNMVKTGTNYYTTNSLAEVSKLTRVEPLTILSKDLISLDYMPDVQNTVLNLFAAYYLQAVNIMTKVHDVEVIRMLDRLNPDRDSTGFLLAEGMTLESFQHSLPMSSVPKIALEDEGGKFMLNDASNLALGKMLNVSIAYQPGSDPQAGTAGAGSDTKTINLQIALRLMATIVPDETIQHLLSFKSQDNSFVERYHAWRAGRISFIKDLMFAQDLIDEWKRAAIHDDSNTMVEIMRRANNAKKFGLLTKNPSLVSASNVFVISEATARSVESRLGGRLSSPKVRDKAFENTYAMLIVVVDREYERVTFYTRGNSTSTDVSLKEIKAANKNGKGPDIGDLLKSLAIGSPLQF